MGHTVAMTDFNVKTVEYLLVVEALLIGKEHLRIIMAESDKLPVDMELGLDSVFYPGLLGGGGRFLPQKLAIPPLIYPKDNRKAILMAE